MFSIDFLKYWQVLFLTMGVSKGCCKTLYDVKRLYFDLFSNYSTEFRPIYNQSEKVQVTIQIHPTNFLALDELKHSFSFNSWFNVSWRDEQLAWNPSDYGGLNLIHISAAKIWTPSMEILNSLTKRGIFLDNESKVDVNNLGEVTWLPSTVIETACRVDVSFFPFDKQNCSVVIHSNYLSSEMHLDGKIYLSAFTDNGGWELVKTDLNYLINEEDQSLEATFTMKRRPVFYVQNIILPIMVLSFLNLMTFWLPDESGEKISFATSVLLSLTVFLSITSGLLPQTSDKPVFITIYISVLLGMSGLTVVMAIMLQCRSAKNYREIMLRSQARSRSKMSLFSDIIRSKGAKIGDVNSLGMEREESRYIDSVLFAIFLIFWILCSVLFFGQVYYQYEFYDPT